MTTILETHRNAIEHFQAGDMDATERSCQEVIELAPHHAEAWHLWGLVKIRRQDHQGAIQCIGRAIGLDPNAAGYYCNLGNIYYQLRKLDDAETCYRWALELKPDYTLVHNNLGNVLSDQGKLDEAVHSYQRAIELKSDYAEAHHNLGLVLNDLGHTSAAADCFRRLLELRPDFVEAHHQLGICLKQQGQLDEAIACYQRALELQPDHAEVLSNLGAARLEQGRAADAEELFRRAIQLKPDHALAYNNLGIIFSDRQQLQDAVVCFQRALELQPNLAEARFGLGKAYFQQGSLPSAVVCFREALELKPGFSQAYHNLGLALTAQGRTADAADVWRAWLEHDPDHPIARHMWAASNGQDSPDRSSDEYVRDTFDVFAHSFDLQLERLEYRAPELVHEAAQKACGSATGLDVLDAGCGTGLCGPLVRPRARKLTGVDLSSKMVDKARLRNVYDDLIVGELTAYLKSSPRAFDLVIAADTLNYFGDLQPVFLAAGKSLRPNGHLIFTVEEAAEDPLQEAGFHLQPHGRFCHQESYVRESLHNAGLKVAALATDTLRMENGQPVRGFIVTATHSN